MALSEGDKAQCRELAGEVAETIITRVITAHIDSCPHGRMLLSSKCFVIGFGSCCGVVGGAIVKLFM